MAETTPKANAPVPSATPPTPAKSPSAQSTQAKTPAVAATGVAVKIKGNVTHDGKVLAKNSVVRLPKADADRLLAIGRHVAIRPGTDDEE